MSSEGAEPAGELKLHRLTTWFDPETAAVVTILLGLFQVLLSVPLGYASIQAPLLFILPLVLGIFIVAGGSFTVANERNPSRLLLRGCACSNLVGLLGATLAFCLYCYRLSKIQITEPCPPIIHDMDYYRSARKCPGEVLAAHCWCLILLLLLYTTGAVLMLILLSVSALRALKKD
ncbi:uncharacterized protein si:dkey-9i23.16 [Labrus mixtus]|uniref:uncharacterized protein si:dkey-9i23.16 n=1 Tax=Labrus mixtus TaxID=508554 RepID=UPI0029C0D0EE|nr:uncharacterized protein si:dkey-9i23.16 [Labrus mixtus]XP_060909255.1 uncharacterized protein si:dkey-9i23.16 [Labrus mixtus]